ncbi:MAG: MarC family protein [Bilophila sp.]
MVRRPCSWLQHDRPHAAHGEPRTRILGKTGLAVLSKLTGLLLAAIAAQVVFTGVKNFLG